MCAPTWPSRGLRRALRIGGGPASRSSRPGHGQAVCPPGSAQRAHRAREHFLQPTARRTSPGRVTCSRPRPSPCPGGPDAGCGGAVFLDPVTGSSKVIAGGRGRGMRLASSVSAMSAGVTAAVCQGGHQVPRDINADKGRCQCGTSPLVAPGLGELLAEVTAAAVYGHHLDEEEFRVRPGHDLCGTPKRTTASWMWTPSGEWPRVIGQRSSSAEPYTVCFGARCARHTESVLVGPPSTGPRTCRPDVAVNPSSCAKGHRCGTSPSPSLPWSDPETPQAVELLREMYAR